MALDLDFESESLSVSELDPESAFFAGSGFFSAELDLDFEELDELLLEDELLEEVDFDLDFDLDFESESLSESESEELDESAFFAGVGSDGLAFFAAGSVPELDESESLSESESESESESDDSGAFRLMPLLVESRSSGARFGLGQGTAMERAPRKRREKRPGRAWIRGTGARGVGHRLSASAALTRKRKSAMTAAEEKESGGRRRRSGRTSPP